MNEGNLPFQTVQAIDFRGATGLVNHPPEFASLKKYGSMLMYAVPYIGPRKLSNEISKSIDPGAASLIIDFIPIAGNIKAGIEASTGTDPITEEELDAISRGLAGAGIIFGPAAKGVSRGYKLAKGSKHLVKGEAIGKIVKDGYKAKVTYGNHYAKQGRTKVLRPNITYTTDAGYTYTTDSFGRIRSAGGTLTLDKASRNNYAQRKEAKKGRSGDEGGHLIATIFKGSGDIDNLVPMSQKLNRSDYKILENRWKKALEKDPPDTVQIKVEPIYRGESKRPISFEIKYKIEDNPWEFTQLDN